MRPRIFEAILDGLKKFVNLIWQYPSNYYAAISSLENDCLTPNGKQDLVPKYTFNYTFPVEVSLHAEISAMEKLLDEFMVDYSDYLDSLVSTVRSYKQEVDDYHKYLVSKRDGDCKSLGQ
jgi:hypothetical protein